MSANISIRIDHDIHPSDNDLQSFPEIFSFLLQLTPNPSWWMWLFSMTKWVPTVNNKQNPNMVIPGPTDCDPTSCWVCVKFKSGHRSRRPPNLWPTRDNHCKESLRVLNTPVNALRSSSPWLLLLRICDTAFCDRMHNLMRKFMPRDIINGKSA